MYEQDRQRRGTLCCATLIVSLSIIIMYAALIASAIFSGAKGAEMEASAGLLCDTAAQVETAVRSTDKIGSEENSFFAAEKIIAEINADAGGPACALVPGMLVEGTGNYGPTITLKDGSAYRAEQVLVYAAMPPVGGEMVRLDPPVPQYIVRRVQGQSI